MNQKLIHKHAWVKTLLIPLVIGGGIDVCLCQNLAPNWSFEQYDVCPSSSGGTDPLPCIPWTHAGTGSPDYFNECADNTWPDVPSNGFGYQFPQTGNGYAGIWCKIDGFENYREYLHAPLNSPMIAGNTYHVSFYVNLSNTCCGTANMGAYFSVLPPASNDWFPIPVTPQIAHPGGFISDTSEWTLVMGCFTPTASYSFISIGNFYDDDATQVDTFCTLGTDHSYYYIEDVVVLPTPSGGVGQLDLGPPVTACQSYTIESGISNVIYQWSTGSYQPSIDVTTSGTYYLTVTGGCTVQVDSVEVEIVDYIPFDIGTDEISFCQGDSFAISLNPNLGTYTWNDGTQGPEYVISESGTYSVMLDNGCISEDEITAEVVPIPIAPWLGPDTFLCPQNEIVFSLDPTLGDFLWQDNSTSSQYTITTPGTYALTISNLCGSDTDEVLILQEELPELDLSPEPILLCAGSTYTLSLDSLAGEYLWSDGSNAPSYEFTEPGTYSVTLTNNCGSDVANITVELVNIPDFNLGDDLVLCPDQFPFIFNPGNIPNATYYDWGNGNNEQEISISAPGVYTLIASNDCFFATDEIEVFIGAETPAFALPDDTVICPGDTLVLSANNTPGEYFWQDSSTMPFYIVDTAGTYSLTISNLCSDHNDTIVIAMASAVDTPDLGPDFSLCPGEEYVLTTGIITESFLWQDMSVADTLLISSPGTYYVTAFGLCASASDTVIVSANNNSPLVELPDHISLCQGESITIDAGISGVDYLWNDGSSASQLIVNAAGVYSLTVSNACGTDSDTVIVVDGGPAPVVDLGTDIGLCAGDVFVLNPTFANVDAWLWQDGSTLPSYSISIPGQFSVQVSNSCGTAFDTINAVLLPAIPPLDLGLDTSVCPGESVVLNITIPDVQILWSDGSTGSSLTTTDDGIYSASITNSCGSSSDTLSVSFLPDIPVLNLGPDQALCPGEVISISPGISNVTYEWQDGSTNNFYSTSQAETIILTISNSCGSSTDTLVVFENNQGPQVDLGPDILACDGEVITIPSGISGVNYLWQDGSTASSFSTSVSGEFILQVSNACGTNTDTIKVMFTQAPEPFDLGADTILCPGESVILSAPNTADEILWQDGSDQLTLIADQPQTYWLQISNACGLTADSLIVSFDDKSPVLHLATSFSWCEGDIITLDATQPFAANYLWSTGATSSSIDVSTPDVYNIIVSSLCQSASQDVDVYPGDDCFEPEVKDGIYIPNVFSPNRDGVNDVFTVSFGPDLNVISMQGSIYDRWGNLVFSSDDNPFEWDGLFAGEQVLAGVYVYLMQITHLVNGSSRTEVFSGDVTLIH